MIDETESIRRSMIATGQPAADLAKADRRWSTDELMKEFAVLGFMAPFVVVRRQADGVHGTMEFVHSPRVYFNFVEDR
jgi:hypothetical protein